jgi:hypothetical protein
MDVHRAILAILLSALGATAAHAHELADNRASLVLRDPTHLSLMLYIRYTEALHKALAPETNYGEFLLTHSAMKPEDFQRQVRRAQEKLQSGVRVTLNGKQEVPIVDWVWPDAARAQSLFRQEVMEATVGGAGRHHDEPIEVRADVMHDREIKGASIRFPEAFGKVLLVWYRARQTWVEASRSSPTVTFD